MFGPDLRPTHLGQVSEVSPGFNRTDHGEHGNMFNVLYSVYHVCSVKHHSASSVIKGHCMVSFCVMKDRRLQICLPTDKVIGLLEKCMLKSPSPSEYNLHIQWPFVQGCPEFSYKPDFHYHLVKSKLFGSIPNSLHTTEVEPQNKIGYNLVN